MNADPLQQLRDVHPPPPPDWWPPAFGWWLIAVVGIATAIVIVRLALAAWRAHQPWRTARRLYNAQYRAYEDGTLPVDAYLSGANQLLRRLAVYAHRDVPSRSATGTAWLARLDELFGTSAFRSGPGEVLAIERFAPRPCADLEAFHRLMVEVLGSRKSRKAPP